MQTWPSTTLTEYVRSGTMQGGASTRPVFWYILTPLLGPGILAASLLVMVRTIAMFELTFLTAGSDSQTLVVALYYAVFAAGVRAPAALEYAENPAALCARTRYL